MANAIVEFNRARSNGRGISNNRGMTLESSRVTENQSDDGGGGIFNNFPGGLTLKAGIEVKRQSCIQSRRRDLQPG